ncbi:RuvC-like resolvase [Mycobacterium phage Labelle]|nr:RuvC-like resolvase [Mycobacterium phage Labelle]
MNRTCYVVAFDPGESTGYCALSISADVLLDPTARLHKHVCIEDAGTINCAAPDGHALGADKHAGLNIFGENEGISKMLEVVENFKTAAIVVEDFIPDMRRMDQARHTLSPVRLMAGFSYGFFENWQKWGMWEGLGLAEERIFIQDRANPKTTCTNERLKEWGLDLKGETRHARDAMRHAFYFLRLCHNLSNQTEKAAEKRHLAWPHYFVDPVAGGYVKPVRVRKPRPPGEVI